MPHNLNDKESVLAWKAIWDPSFSGIAIVNKDFSFRSANPQFCKLLGVTPADLIGKKFQDITPPNIRELEEKNANLIISGLVDFYLLPKKYEFSNGRKVKAILLVTRAPLSGQGDFEFFVSRIMVDNKGSLLTAHKKETSLLKQSSQSLTMRVLDFLMKYWKPIAIASAVVVGALSDILNIRLFKND